MGTGALLNLTPGIGPQEFSATDNTGSGFQALYSNTTGFYNTASGAEALYSNTSGSNDTAVGYQALSSNTTGVWNIALGSYALMSNRTGGNNTAAGVDALTGNSTGSGNTAFGSESLAANYAGVDNTASGVFALARNTNGGNNTASGAYALYNSYGNHNTASGAYALFANTNANFNTANGYAALYSNTTGVQNTATGAQALYNNKAGNFNVALGMSALYANTGSVNIALGFRAGYALTTGSNNIDIGSQGAAGDAYTIKIGTEGMQHTAYMAGIYAVPLSGRAVVVTSTGQLGASSASSERFKTAIAPMGSDSDKLEALKPVTFHYKSDPNGPKQYGLIAEEVAKVYPELVIRGENNRIDGVRYDELAPMLLNEVKQEKQQLATQAEEIRELRSMVLGLETAQRKNSSNQSPN